MRRSITGTLRCFSGLARTAAPVSRAWLRKTAGHQTVLSERMVWEGNIFSVGCLSFQLGSAFSYSNSLSYSAWCELQ